MQDTIILQSLEQQWAILRDLQYEIERVKSDYDCDQTRDGAIIRGVLKTVLCQIDHNRVDDECIP